MAQTITIKLNGRADEQPSLPPMLVSASRATRAAPDPFLPESYLRATGTFDVGSAARGTEGAATIEKPVADDEVILLELADGGTLITSAARLRDSLRQTHPDWLDADGAIPFERLRAAGAAPGRGLGEAMGGLVSKVFTFVAGEASDAIIEAAVDKLKELGGLNKIELGVTWAGSKALMWAIESRLVKNPGLYRWVGGSGDEKDLEAPVDKDLAKAVADKLPMLVFVHGTGSSSLGSFGELRAGELDLWTTLERRFTGGIFAFEHRTLSESPIENALQLARALPRGACINLVSHSRGGLVADLLCMADFDSKIDAFGRPKNMPGTGDVDPASAEARGIAKQLDDAYHAHRADLRLLAEVLREKQLVVQRYVRAASPANGTKLASGNFDVFLSGLLTLIGQVPFFFGSPFYAAFKRVVVEIAKNRTNPHLVPGIEAMLPDSPMARLLRDAPVRPGLVMSVIAGDIQGGNLLKRMGVLLTDFLLFDREDNDLVVNTTAMLSGIAPRANSRVLFDRGADVSHFRYFTNIGTRSALRDWLVAPDPLALDIFHPLPDPADYAAALEAGARRDAIGVDRPIVVVLPGVMGSHLQVGGKDRVWFDPADIATGGLTKIAWGKPGVEAEDLFAMTYGKLCERLSESHRVERFPYDWRQPLDVLGERFAEFLDRLVKQTNQPIRILAHSMGGLVVRAAIYKRPTVMDAVMAREGARLVMLGTPHQGAHSMVENLIGKGDTLRMLVRLDVMHSMQQVLDIVAGFRGALQLLPKPGFTDMFQGQLESGGGAFFEYQKAQTWVDQIAPKVQDFWFGNGQVGKPSQAVLDSAAWLWTQDGATRPTLPAAYESKSTYVYGVAPNTACGIREEGGRLKMVGTSHGDGTVSWESGRIGGIGQYLYMPAAHGDLASTKEYFPALVELLTSGSTSQLFTAPPASRAVEQPRPVTYDAGPPGADDPDVLSRSLLGGSLRNRVPPRRKRRLDVRVRAMDLRFVTQPIMVGHFERDPIAGPQLLIDRDLLDNDLSERHRLGLYAGPLGTATVVLRAPNDAERLRGSVRGAVVTGLGPYDGALSQNNLTEAARAGALRYLLQVIDVLGKADREVSLATLLVGYNSSANLSVDISVEALVRGVMEANERFYQTTRLNIRIARLDIVELYIDTAITAVYALRNLEGRLSAQAEQQQTQLVCSPELDRGEGRRPRLYDNRNASYWPRLIITDADRDDATRPVAAVGAAPAVALADSLRFLYVGQRARAESIMQQRQPGLIERLVRQQIHDATWNEDFGRMLFQLMVPHDFKDAARQFQQVVLVVDSTTANLPWELMLADDPTRSDSDKRPLALRTAVVRQLSSTRFRRQVRQNIARTALVIGNPSSKGFVQAFSTPQSPLTDEPPDLPGAKTEAEAVARLLSGAGYEVKPVVGGDSASTVLAALYHQPWRILHISAHGVFGLQHSDGRFRSGVLMSDGLLITAAEIEAMETVPDVVFLNCCHLGTVDMGSEGNKLASSVSRELIDIGVRCVVVAGWAVNDEGARLFGETFYQELLLRRRPFGEAVFTARTAVWNARPQDITWGAFQAYGDPAFCTEPRADGGGASATQFASPEELLDELTRVRAELSRRGTLSDRDTRAQVDALASLLKDRCQPGWINAPGLQSALGATWYDLREFDKAREALLRAVRSEDKDGQVPIHDIEKLANVEARLGERLAQAEVRPVFEPGPKAAKGAKQRAALRSDVQRPDDVKSAEALISLAIQRLRTLDGLVARRGEVAANIERSGLLGSAYKRLANLYALRVLAASRIQGDKTYSAANRAAAAKLQAAAGPAMVTALRASVAAYGRDAGSLGSDQFSGYLTLNRLALDALTPWEGDELKRDAIELARQCATSAEQVYARSANVWEAVMQPEALLVEKLIEGDLGKPGDAGQAVLDGIVGAYVQSLTNVTIKPVQVDSMASQMELLSRFCDALMVAYAGDAEVDGHALYRTASRLIELQQRLRPGWPQRKDRPSPPARTGGPEVAVRAGAPQRRKA